VVFFADIGSFEILEEENFACGFTLNEGMDRCPDVVAEEIGVAGLEEIIGEDIRKELEDLRNPYQIGDVVEFVGRLTVKYPFSNGSYSEYNEPPEPEFGLEDFVHCKVSTEFQNSFLECDKDGDIEHRSEKEGTESKV
jgi:hypothetical protein